MKRVKLTARLKTLADFIENGASVADIGSNHGYLAVYLAQNNTMNRIIATDISTASLDAARRTALEYNMSEAIIFHTASGLDGISPDDIDTIIAAGLGGETILSILDNAPWTKTPGKRLILQPQSKYDVLFRFLYDKGYDIKTVKYVWDKKKRYIVVHAEGIN